MRQGGRDLTMKPNDLGRYRLAAQKVGTVKIRGRVNDPPFAAGGESGKKKPGGERLKTPRVTRVLWFWALQKAEDACPLHGGCNRPEIIGSILSRRGLSILADSSDGHLWPVAGHKQGVAQAILP